MALVSGCVGETRKPMGRAIRWLPDRSIQSTSSIAGARNHLDQRLIDLWETHLNASGIGMLNNWFDLGGDPTSYATMISASNGLFRTSLPFAPQDGFVSIDRLANLIARRIPPAQDPLCQAGPLTPTLLYLHGDIFSRGAYFNELQRYLNVKQRVRVLGAEDSEEYETVEEMSAHIRNLLETGITQPFSVAGFCSSGPVAFEVACQLRERGHAVHKVVAIGSRSTVQTSIRRHSGAISDAMDPTDVLAKRGLLMNRCSAAARAYRPRYFEGKVTLLWPAGESTPADHIAAEWQQHARDLEVRSISGTHLTCLTRYLKELGSILSSVLGSPETDVEDLVAPIR